MQANTQDIFHASDLRGLTPDELVKTQIVALLCDRNVQLIMIAPSAAQKIPYLFVRFTRQ